MKMRHRDYQEGGSWMEEMDSCDFSDSKDSSVVGANGKAAGLGRAA